MRGAHKARRTSQTVNGLLKVHRAGGNDSMYAMRRANGDWFALEDHGHLRVPVFHSSRGAVQARTRNSGMLLFTPVALDARALKELAPADGGCLVSFWLVENPSAKLTSGQPLEHAQLALLVLDSWGQKQGDT